MPIPDNELLEQLVNDELSAVVFVRDYLQLEFRAPPTINVYSRCRVVAGDAPFEFGQPEFANAMIAQIGKVVLAVSSRANVFTIAFRDGTCIEIPFGEGTFNGPEAFVFWGGDEHWGVWPG